MLTAITKVLAGRAGVILALFLAVDANAGGITAIRATPQPAQPHSYNYSDTNKNTLPAYTATKPIQSNCTAEAGRTFGLVRNDSKADFTPFRCWQGCDTDFVPIKTGQTKDGHYFAEYTRRYTGRPCR